MRISPAKIYSPTLGIRRFSELSSRGGFTLLEILIVLMLLAAVTVVIMPRLGVNQKAKLQSQIRHLSVIGRELHNASRLQNKIYRLAIRMDEKEGHSYWVESTSDKILLKTSEEIEEEKKENRDKPVTSAFSADSTIMKEPKSLPPGIFFETVEVKTFEEPFTAGVAYIHFFPQGPSEEAMIHVGDRKNLKYSIYFHPLSGQGRVYNQAMSLKDFASE